MKRGPRVTNLPLSEDFAAWRDHPVTKLVLKALRAAREQQKAQWDKASWEGGVVRAPELERLLLELRVRADAYQALEEMTVGDIAAWLGIEDAE